MTVNYDSDDFSAVTQSVTRRSMLRRIAGAGLAATATAGMTGLLGARTARASTINSTATAGTGYLTQSDAEPLCSCTTLCVLSEGNCGSAHCATGKCCYNCDGCGINGHICLSGCNCDTNCYYCG